MEIKYEEGDLFARAPKTGNLVIPHVVNNCGQWGSGFVVPLGERYPLAEQAYREWYKGTISSVQFQIGETFPVVTENTSYMGCDRNVTIAHMLAQDNTAGRKGIPLNYDALDKCMATVGKLAIAKKASIHAPLFGAGIGGGSWDKIEAMIQKHWIDAGIPVTVYYMPCRLPPGWTPSH